MKYSDNDIKNLLDGIYSGTITEYNLPDDLYFAIADYLKRGVYEGFGKTLYQAAGRDLELLAELRENIYMFSAAKTFQQVKDITGLLIDAEGKVRTRSEFNALGAQTYDLWSNVWGKTEYNTAIGQAQAASKWNEIEKNKDLLPMLRYSAVMDPNTSEICAPLDGIVAPVDDPIWRTVAPLNHFNCRCVLLQEDGDTKATSGNEEKAASVEGEMQNVFKSNPGIDQVVFNESHPYFDVAPRDRGFAKTNFGLPIPDAAAEAGKPIPVPTLEPTTVKEAEQWAVDNEIAKTVSYKGINNVEFANIINKQLLDLKNEYGVTYDEIKTFTQTKNGVANTLMQNYAKINSVTKEISLSRLEINKAYFKEKTLNDVTIQIKAMRLREWTTAESLQDIVNHEFAHRLTSVNVFNDKFKAKLESLVFDYKRLGRYASKNFDETLAEIFCYYKKTGSAPPEWIAKFNRWSDVKIK